MKQNSQLGQKLKRTSKGKLSLEEIQHLKRCGVHINHKKISTDKRPIRRFAAWWETTCLEKCLEDVAFLLKNAALLDIINLVAGITIIISLISWLATEKQRRNAEIYQAWQVITAAYEQSGSGGRKEALEFLNSEPRRFPLFWLNWERQSLAGLAAPKAYLVGLQLQGADLVGANLQKANLFMANLQEANLVEANLQEAVLFMANLQEAVLRGANLQKADLRGANLQKADLFIANLQGADLAEANLQEANLFRANLQKADLDNAENLTRVQIKSACFWEGANYKSEWNREMGGYIPLERDNTEFIEELKKDKSSDPKNPVDCSYWKIVKDDK